MNIDAGVLGQVFVATSIMFSVILAYMAKGRGLSVVGWAILGLIPYLNLIGWIVLLCRPLKKNVKDSNAHNQSLQQAE